jgi:circadian clock protein KaiB
MSTAPHYKFRLYVAGDGPHSTQAVANINAICREHLAERHEIEIVDVLREPQRALADFVMLTPLLVKLSPAPIRKITGSLSQRGPVLQALGLPA